MKTTDPALKERFRHDPADLCLPKWMLFFELVIFVPAAVIILRGILHWNEPEFSPPLLLVPLVQFTAGVLMPFCIRNQRLIMLPQDDRFVYRTMFGNMYLYSFSDVLTISYGVDSKKLIMRSGKSVHIESIARKSPRFTARIKQLEEKFRQEASDEIAKWKRDGQP